MTSDFSSTLFGSEFTASCKAGYAFFRSSGGSSFIASTTKTATCKYSSQNSNTYWSYNDGTWSLDNCLGNILLFTEIDYQ